MPASGLRCLYGATVKGRVSNATASSAELQAVLGLLQVYVWRSRCFGRKAADLFWSLAIDGEDLGVRDRWGRMGGE